MLLCEIAKRFHTATTHSPWARFACAARDCATGFFDVRGVFLEASPPKKHLTPLTKESWTETGQVSDLLAAYEGWAPQEQGVLEAVAETFIWALFDATICRVQYG